MDDDHESNNRSFYPTSPSSSSSFLRGRNRHPSTKVKEALLNAQSSDEDDSGDDIYDKDDDIYDEDKSMSMTIPKTLTNLDLQEMIIDDKRELKEGRQRQKKRRQFTRNVANARRKEDLQVRVAQDEATSDTSLTPSFPPVYPPPQIPSRSLFVAFFAFSL